MTSWISKIFVSNAPRTWGSALRDNQIVFRSARKYFFDYLTTPTYERTLLRYGTELSRRRKIATKPYWDPILMEHVSSTSGPLTIRSCRIGGILCMASSILARRR
jgi:hypothetical protein